MKNDDISDEDFDELLKDAAIIAVEKYAGGYSDIEVEKAPDRIQKIADDLLAKHKSETEKKSLSTLMKRVAAIIALFLAAGLVFSSNVEAFWFRVSRLFVEDKGTYSVLEFETDGNVNEADFVYVLPGYIPEGFEITDYAEMPNQFNTVYSKGQNTIGLIQRLINDEIQSDTEETDYTEKTINNVTVNYKYKDNFHTYAWQINNNSFLLSTNITDVDEIEKIVISLFQ